VRRASLLAAAVAFLGLARSAPADAGKKSDFASVGPATLEVFDPPSPGDAEALVPAFELEKHPVTNAEFLAFVKSSPQWLRGRVSPLFADERYLSYWQGPTTLGQDADPEGPVVGVSWFAAKAYCEARGERLPTENEWELAAAASETSARGAGDPAWTERILTWYSRPTPRRLGKVGQGSPNYWGIYDLNGLVWEWVYDFNARPPRTDDRAGSRFTCGGTSARPEDRADYASFMRFAFRAALRPSYTATSLGFRCARNPVRGAS
jgi:formylglycine-generating enzyme required for sulfatase activity